MPFFVYIIQSLKDNSFYKGFSEHPLLRLQQHNNAESHYTASKMPWKLVFVEELPTKRDALIREKNLKKLTTERIIALIASHKNIVRKLQ